MKCLFSDQAFDLKYFGRAGKEGDLKILQFLMLQIIENMDNYVETIVENQNIGIEISEGNDYMLQVFTIRAKRKKLIWLKYVAQVAA